MTFFPLPIVSRHVAISENDSGKNGFISAMHWSLLPLIIRVGDVI